MVNLLQKVKQGFHSSLFFLKMLLLLKNHEAQVFLQAKKSITGERMYFLLL